MKRDYTLYINDMLECIERIEEFVGDMSYEEFVEDDKTSSAMVRKLEIMGEASKNIPIEIRREYKEIPWSDIVYSPETFDFIYPSSPHGATK